MSFESDDEGLQTLTEWVQGELYAELVHMPLWTLSAFGSLSDGDKLKNTDVRLSLIRYLCSKHKEKAPDDLLDRDKTMKLADFFPVVKAAVFHSKKILDRLEYASHPSDASSPFT
jgi:hypothetical protein